jgi:hypothetical protein
MKSFVIVMVIFLAIDIAGKVFFLAVQQRERSMTATALDALLDIVILIWGVLVLVGA